MRCRVAVAAVLLGLSASWVSAQVPAGGEFQVNTYTPNSQWWAGVSSDSRGDFLVTWTSVPQDGSGGGAFARLFDASGQPRGTEFQVNTYTPDWQDAGTAAFDARGDFAVVWSSYGQDGPFGWGVFAQRYDAAGDPRGGEFQVNTYTTLQQSGFSVASDAAGDFVVVWQGGQDGSGYAVRGRRYDSAGVPLSGEFLVNSYTFGDQRWPWVASDSAGDFVVVWASAQDGSGDGIFAQRYDAAGARLGGEFQVNTYTPGNQILPLVVSDPAGVFIVSWTSLDGSGQGVFARRYDSAGVPSGGEFRLNSYTMGDQYTPAVAMDAAGNFVATWVSSGQDGSGSGIFARRFDASGALRGDEFQVNTYTTGDQQGSSLPRVASDEVGNFVVAWSSIGPTAGGYNVFLQRYGGLVPALLAVDPSGNGVLEANERVAAKPSWQNLNGAPLTFAAAASGFTGPPATGVSYLLRDGLADYGLVGNEVTAECTNCYEVEVQQTGGRPASHWDASVVERITPDALGQAKVWKLHVGGSFTDVPSTSAYYRFVETLLHKRVTGGCTASNYCPTTSATRGQMAIFTLLAKEGASYLPSACGAVPMFGDVAVTSPYCRYVEELVRRGVAGGCGGGNYCPNNVVTRGQMPIFVLKTLDPTLDPPGCGTPVFADVPASSPYCKWIEELARRGVVGGCGGGNYCPSNPVTRGQMAVFISVTFGLTLYGP